MNNLSIEWTHLREVLERYANYFIDRARTTLLQNGTNASGTLTNSFEKEISITDDRISVKIHLEDYWKWVENGRGAGKFPPLDRIREWIETKPKLPTVDQLAFLIGRKIAEEGTEPQPFFEPSKLDTENYFEESIYNAVKEDVADYIENTLLMYREMFGKGI